MTTALQRRLDALNEIRERGEEIREERVTSTLEEAREEYRSAYERIDLYGEAIAARPYVTLLERRVAQLESQLRTQSKPHTW